MEHESNQDTIVTMVTQHNSIQKRSINVYSTESDQNKIIIMSLAANLMSKSDIVSSLPLQMALYFNAFFAPWWIITHICTLALKYKILSITYQVILAAAHFLTFTVEIVRLYLGFTGNLMEKIPELSGFWITTFILQLPLTCFLLFHRGNLILPIETAVDIVQICFVIFEVIAGFIAVRKVAKHQVTKFQQQVLNKQK